MAYAFLVPALAVLGVFVFWPMLSSLVTSFTDARIIGPRNFVGLDNYAQLVGDGRFRNALGNTALYTVVTAPISVGLALFFAILLNRKLPGRGLFRSVIFFPFIASLGIISIAWAFMLDPQVGIIAAWLSEIGLPIGNGVRDPAWAMPAVMIVGIWRNTGFFMVMYLAGLQSIPGELNEAAAIDGASGIRRFTNITWPLLANTTLFVVIIAAIFSFQAFDQMYVMTSGGPFFKTETLVMLIYSAGFKDYDLGYASAVSWVLVLIVLVFSLIQLGYFRKKAVKY
ncbi:sugar ABC transporter permease [Cryobacterium zongtaii]|uniref:Sugar ABC transporter permease n=1 Tax=Cryobacterium zongtaii TaxID=1259217 RepID=A0A2S3Z9L1_9MICO|nr:sugar ABC transporter permease [Cryobacterium zongtaii]POH62245.1 sugar ABC transporter permease [Cryobacterium zongtaii]